MAEAVIDSRMANALFADAQLSGTASKVVNKLAVGPAGAEQALRTLESFREAYGGLWVGGHATLTDSALTFEPNGLNRVLHENGESLRFELPLGAIRAVATRPSWFTGIIEVSTDGGTFSLRCYRSKRFAEAIRQAAGSA